MTVSPPAPPLPVSGKGAAAKVAAPRSRTRPPAPAQVRVSLLPPELKAARRRGGLKRALVGVVVITGVLVGAGVVAASKLAEDAAARADAAEQPASALAMQVAEYAPIRQLEQRAELAEAAARVGGSTQIDWQKLLGEVREVMPSDFTITGVVIDSASPITPYTQGTTPLDKARIGTVTITAASSTIESLPAWLGDLPTVTGFSDAVPTVTGVDSTYTVSITMHITTEAYITPVEEGEAG